MSLFLLGYLQKFSQIISDVANRLECLSLLDGVLGSHKLRLEAQYDMMVSFVPDHDSFLVKNYTFHNLPCK